MGRKQKEMHPNVILATSIYAGLAALVRLARKRVDKRTRKYLESILTIWSTAIAELKIERGNSGRPRLDFTPIRNAEANLRKLFLKILWHSTRRFGNREFKRVYSWLEGTVGPLNALLNYLGARLRDLAMIRFPFPEPEKFQVRVYADGTRLVIQKKHVARYLQDGAVETYWKAGYKGNRKHPTVLLVHPTLPGLDFVDMIRAHGVELVRQCFIYNVPRSEAHRYIRLLIHRLTPFLDYVYTEGASGRIHFEPDADKVLREIVLEIRSLNGKYVGKRDSITHELDTDIPEPSVEILRIKIFEILGKTGDKETREKLVEILDYIDQGRIVDRDVEKLYEQAVSLAQREGNKWHRILLSDFHHPKSVRSVIFAEDTMLDKLSSVLVVGELPVMSSSGAGQIDLTVFIRRIVKGAVYWTPIMILEIKSKTSFDFNLYAVQTGKSEGCPPALYAWKRVMDESEWKKAMRSNPDDRTLQQLGAYEKSLLEISKERVPAGVRLPKHLWKGVIVLDTDQDYSETFKAFNFLLEELLNGILTNTLELTKSLAFSLKSKITNVESPRIGLLLMKGESMTDFIEECSPSVSLSVDDPFRERVKDERLLTLYISVPSPTSSGNIAAWISRNWHLLNHLQEVSHVVNDRPRIFWLDLLGDYPTEQLVRRRFGLESMLKEKRVGKEAFRKLALLLDSINFINLREQIETTLSGRPNDLSESLRQLSHDDTLSNETIIVIDGWSELKEMATLTTGHILRAIEIQLLEALPRYHTNIIWIDSGTSHTRMNQHYQRACIQPLPHNSPRRLHIDEIIYNIPTAPRVFGWRSPREEDSRIIIQDTPTQIEPWKQPIRVPHLKNIASRFRGISRRDGILTEEEITRNDFLQEPMYGRSVSLGEIRSSLSPLSSETIDQLLDTGVTLIPSLIRPREQIEEEIERKEPIIESSWNRITEVVTSIESQSLTDRMTFNLHRPPPQPHRSKNKYSEFIDITRGWYYDKMPIDMNDIVFEGGITRKPPSYLRTGLDDVDSLAARRMELQRLKSAAQFFMREYPNDRKLFSCCREIARLCFDTLQEPYDEKILLTTLQKVKDIIHRDPDMVRLWMMIEGIRDELCNVLTSENSAVLHMAQELNPEILSLYGNNLFLALFSVVRGCSVSLIDDAVITLWESIAVWQLYQMGFRRIDSEEIAKSQYDFQFIHTNLLLRANRLKTQETPISTPEKVIYGQIIWAEREGKYDGWLVLPDEEQPLIGALEGLGEQSLRRKWYQCMTEPSTLKVSAWSMTESPVRNQVALANIGDDKILWFTDELEGEEQWMNPVVLEFATAKEDGRILRWFKLSQIPEGMYLELEKSKPSRIPKVDASVDALLLGAFGGSQEIEDVTAEVSVDLDSNSYRVEFSSGHSYELKDTSALIRLLKHPYLKGAPLRTEDGRLLFWDHKTDIEYSDVVDRRSKKKHVINLSFLKPLVHRVSFYILGDLFPKNCTELLATSDGGAITLVVKVDDDRRNRGEFNYLTVELKGIPKKSQLRALEDEWLNPYEMELLVGCESVVDASIGKEFTLEFDVSLLRGVRLPSGLREDSRLIESLTQEEEEEEELLLPEGEWSLSYELGKKGIQWSLRSSRTGGLWMDRKFETALDATLNLEEMVKKVIEDMKIVGAFKDKIFNFDEILNDMRGTLSFYGWGDERPECYAEVEKITEGIEITLRTRGNDEIEVYHERISLVGDDDIESVIAALDEEVLVDYIIKNQEELSDRVRKILD
jgi:hypothetical protein